MFDINQSTSSKASEKVKSTEERIDDLFLRKIIEVHITWRQILMQSEWGREGETAHVKKSICIQIMQLKKTENNRYIL